MQLSDSELYIGLSMMEVVGSMNCALEDEDGWKCDEPVPVSVEEERYLPVAEK